MNLNEITSPLRSSLLLLPSPLGVRTKAPRERCGPRGPPCSPLLLLSPRRASQPPRLRWASTATQSSPALFLLPGMLFPADISVAHKLPLSGIGAKPAVVTQNSPGWGGGHGGVSETCWAYKDTPNLQGQRAHTGKRPPVPRAVCTAGKAGSGDTEMPESSPDTQAAGVPLGMDSPRLRVAA